MSKQDQINQIVQKFDQIGVSCKTGNGTDISVATEFLDAGWGTGNKKINYNALIFFDESSQTIFMWELTKEVGSGFSFGGSSETSFQSGTTLFRKVKSVQYGFDGKAYEYTLNLGAIPKTVKETAKQNGWKFKIVLSKNKAMYPAGYVPEYVSPLMEQSQQPPQTQPEVFCSNCGMHVGVGVAFCSKCGLPTGAIPSAAQSTQPQQQSTQPQQQSAQPQQGYTQPQQQAYGNQRQNENDNNQYNNPQGQFYANSPNKKSSKVGIFGLIGFILLGLITLILLLAGKSSITGWVVSVIVFTGAFILQRKLTKKGCLLNLILWIVTGFILFLTFGLTAL